MKKMIKTPFVVAMGTGLVSAFSLSMAQAAPFETDSHLFEITKLSKPYMETANEDSEGKCGQGKCGQGNCGTPPPQ